MIQTQQQNSVKNWVLGVEYKNKKDQINEFQLNEEKKLNPFKKMRQTNCKSEQN